MTAPGGSPLAEVVKGINRRKSSTNPLPKVSSSARKPTAGPRARVGRKQNGRTKSKPTSQKRGSMKPGLNIGQIGELTWIVDPTMTICLGELSQATVVSTP